MRLGERQKQFLARVCQSNGGGVSADHDEEKVMRNLEAKGLIQGKLGQPWRAVHTNEGLRAYRVLVDAGEL